MILRWTAASLREAEQRFRKVADYRSRPTLVTALRAQDLKVIKWAKLKMGKTRLNDYSPVSVKAR